MNGDWLPLVEQEKAMENRGREGNLVEEAAMGPSRATLLARLLASSLALSRAGHGVQNWDVASALKRIRGACT
jgi:hypothetical protein